MTQLSPYRTLSSGLISPDTRAAAPALTRALPGLCSVQGALWLERPLWRPGRPANGKLQTSLGHEWGRGRKSEHTRSLEMSQLTVMV